MSSDAVIEIFGEITSSEALKQVAWAASIKGKIDWDRRVSEDEAAELMIDAAAQEKPFVMTLSDTRGFSVFDALRSECQKADLSYVVSIGEGGGEGYTVGYAWRPGMMAEESFDLDGSAPVVRIDDLKRTVALGIEAVEKLVARIETVATVGRLSALPDVVDTWNASFDVPAR